MRNHNNLLKSPIPQWYRNVKVILNPYPGLDHHQKLMTSRESPLAHAYHVWSTSVIAIVELPCSQNDTKNDRTTDHITSPALAQ